MERHICTLLLNILLMFGLINPAFASPVATSFQLPLANYPADDACLKWGGYNSDYSGRHLADDACASAGTDVLAVANGVVKFAGQYKTCTDHGNWGYLIIIEHSLSDGSVVNSIYGHIAPIDGIVAGVEVAKGQHIGDIVSMNCWDDHIHFGMYNGPYSEITCSYDSATGTGSCNAHGYISDWPGKYVDPTDFISSHSTDTSLPYTAIQDLATGKDPIF